MFSGASFSHALREAAPGLSRRFFSCQCQGSRSQHIYTAARTAFRKADPASHTPSTARIFSHARPSREEYVGRIRWYTSSARRNATDTQAAVGRTVKKSRWPETSSSIVAYWLLGSAASVFGIVVFGGLTRLTESGLSITEWKPVTGSLPPRSEADWAAEFLKYQSSPEFHLLNSRMTLEEFKSIYWMEWIHRLWGRAIGLTFVLPAVYFVARGRVSKSMSLRLLGISGLIGFQGFLGWWMVKSGLKDDLFAAGSNPRVSQYRLAAHLGAAFIVYLTMIQSSLSILRTNKILSQSPTAAQSMLSALRHPALRPFKIATTALCGLVFTTAMSGALVAGLDAGLIYNEFPYMGVGLTPPKSELFDKWYSHVPPDANGQHSDLVWRNMCENPSLVQLDHRILATTTFMYVHALWAYMRYSHPMQKLLPAAAKSGVHGVVGFAWMQVILGISTLWYLVPTPLASMHQAGALALLTWSFVLGGRVWFPRYAAKVLQQRLGGAVRTTTPASAKPATSSSSGMPNVAMAALPVAAFAGWALSSPMPPTPHLSREAEETSNQELDFLRKQSSMDSHIQTSAPRLI